MAAPNNKKKRIRVWTPEERAAHRVFEKSRREAFNDSMIDLARQVPSLNGTRRLNKHMIVEHSIARHQEQRQLLVGARQMIRELLEERDAMLVEVNQWRLNASMPLKQPNPPDQRLQELELAENESFGTFPNGFGENPVEGETEYESMLPVADGPHPTGATEPTLHGSLAPNTGNFQPAHEFSGILGDPDVFDLEAVLSTEGPNHQDEGPHMLSIPNVMDRNFTAQLTSLPHSSNSHNLENMDPIEAVPTQYPTDFSLTAQNPGFQFTNHDYLLQSHSFDPTFNDSFSSTQQPAFRT